jgi:predicted nucleotidyltransferase
MNSTAKLDKIMDKHTKKVLLACRDAVRRNWPDARIVLYGSRARGEGGPESDLDLLVLLNQEVTSEITRSIRDMLYETGLQNDLVISVIARSLDTWNSPIWQATALYKEIEKEGIDVK